MKKYSINEEMVGLHVAQIQSKYKLNYIWMWILCYFLVFKCYDMAVKGEKCKTRVRDCLICNKS